MKPKGLKFPFKWEERRPHLEGGVLFIPQFYSAHTADALSPFFLHDAPTFVEYCSGNGDWVVEQARRCPDKNWIAVEKRFDRVRKIWSKRENLKLSNLLIVCGDALTFSLYYAQKQSLEGVYVHFPDPWPKQRQAKHRLIQREFIDAFTPLIKEGGRATFVTDDPPYRDQMIAEMQNVEYWKCALAQPFYREEEENYGSSWFERLWREKGRTIFYMEFIKR